MTSRNSDVRNRVRRGDERTKNENLLLGSALQVLVLTASKGSEKEIEVATDLCRSIIELIVVSRIVEGLVDATS